MIKHTLTAAALATALAVPAYAQQQPQQQDQQHKAGSTAQTPAMQQKSGSTAQAPAMQQNTGTMKTNFVQSQSSNEWRGSKIIGASVYGPDNNSIGEINDVIVGSDGKIQAAVVGVGGFLGVGEKDVALPFESLTINRKANSASIDKITVSYTKDQLKDAPKFAYYDPSNSNRTTGSGSSSGTMNNPDKTPAK